MRVLGGVIPGHGVGMGGAGPCGGHRSYIVDTDHHARVVSVPTAAACVIEGGSAAIVSRCAVLYVPHAGDILAVREHAGV